MEQEEIQIVHTTVRIYHGDIRDLDADIIVSSDNNEFTMARGVARALLERGGPEILQEAQKALARKKMQPGDVIVTNAGQLNAKKIFHCAVCDDRVENPVALPGTVSKLTYECLLLADRFAYKSIAFPAIGTGPQQVDAELVSKSMIQKVFDYLHTTSTGLETITFSLYGEDAWQNFFRNFWKKAALIKFEETKPIRLTILRRNGTNYIDLTSNETISCIKVSKVSSKTLQKFSNALEEFATSGASKFYPGGLQELGEKLYQQLLGDVGPNVIQIRSENMFLKLDDDLLNIPWELCYEGKNIKNFLGLKYNIGRQVVVSPKFLGSSYQTRSLEYPLRILLLADPTETLPGALKECEEIHKELSKIVGINENLELKSGSEITLNGLLKDFDRYDIVHFAGHAYFNKKEPDQSGWEINRAKKEYLTAAVMAEHAAPPIVFANACESGIEVTGEELRTYQSQIVGIASGFLMGGIKNYIGTFTYVNDKTSIDLAVEFYKKLVTGETVGSSLRHARNYVFEKYPNNILWASYMLYGDPEFKLPEIG